MILVNSCKDGTNGDEQPVARVCYDGQCPLCRREIAHYRRLRGAERLEWVDIGREDARLPAGGPTRAEAMARMHVQDASGNWHTGAWAFAEMWSHLPIYRRLAGFLHITRTLPVLDRAYSVFAHWRMQRRCDPAACVAANPGVPDAVNGHQTPIDPDRAERLHRTEGERQCV